MVDALVLAGPDGLAGQHIDHRLLEGGRHIAHRHLLARRAPGLDPAGHGRLQAGEGEVVRGVARTGQTPRERDRLRVALLAYRSMTGPPGKPRFSTRAILSNASPAASSMVAPIGRTSEVMSVDSRSEECRRDQQRHRRLRQRAVLQLVHADVRGEVVDPVQRLAQRVRVRLRRRDTDQQRTREPGPGGDSDAVQIPRAHPLPSGRGRSSAPWPPDAPGRPPPARRRRSARARRRWRRWRRRAGCYRGRCRRRSRRRSLDPQDQGFVSHCSRFLVLRSRPQRNRRRALC